MRGYTGSFDQGNCPARGGHSYAPPYFKHAVHMTASSEIYFVDDCTTTLELVVGKVLEERPGMEEGRFGFLSVERYH